MTAMTAQRFRMFAVPACAGWLVVLFYGCSGEQHPVCPSSDVLKQGRIRGAMLPATIPSQAASYCQ